MMVHQSIPCQNLLLEFTSTQCKCNPMSDCHEEDATTTNMKPGTLNVIFALNRNRFLNGLSKEVDRPCVEKVWS